MLYHVCLIILPPFLKRITFASPTFIYQTSSISSSSSVMLKPFMTCLTFLHKKAKILLNQLRSMDIMSDHCCRRGPNNRFSSKLFISSFVDMGISNQFKQVFKLIDTNDDGQISTSELSEILSCLGYKNSIAAKEAKSMVSVLDSNGDGFVDLDDFMVIVNDSEGKFGSDNEQEEYLMDAFLLFDTEKNGLISAKELRRFMLKLGFDNCSIRECKRMIKVVDKNGDGFVDYEEFRSMMKSGLAN
ncbi:hypothetical protein VNO77_20814 [Canavalia gladiata]|uniref:EF-hand domain-containing protein n=1 Tax=Canavalia gladiata TaxID=3824 RepID=A0AAN9LPY1_CANGL